MLTEAARDTGDAPGRVDDVVIGSGDDAAVLNPTGPVVVSTDTAVEGRHFRFEWSTPEQVGARAVVQSAADIAAMGGVLSGVVVSLGCPPETPVDRLLALNAGVVEQTHRYGAPVLGGDLVATSEVVLTVTSVGSLKQHAPTTLAGARPGDVLAVSGPLGAAAGGLAVLASGDEALAGDYASIVEAFRLPQPDLTQGPVAAGAGAHAMTDVSDGLIEELVTMSAASNVHLDVTSALVPRVDGLDALAVDLDVTPYRWILTGGEDHQLLAAFAPGDVPEGWTTIGAVDDGPAAATVDGGAVGDLQGWQSFS